MAKIFTFFLSNAIQQVTDTFHRARRLAER